MRIRKYHGSEDRNAVNEASGVEPRLGGENGIDIQESKGQLKEELKPNQAYEEMRLLRDEVVLEFIVVPCP